MALSPFSSFIMYFIHLDVLMLGAYAFTIVIPSGELIPLYHVTGFCLKIILSIINIATSAFFWLSIVYSILFHPSLSTFL
jgi:hypothetical protein